MRSKGHTTLTMVCILTVAATTRSPVQSIDHLNRSGEEGYQYFRIPAVVATVRGTLLAFAEGRKYGCDDAGDTDLVVKRSADGGNTTGQI